MRRYSSRRITDGTRMASRAACSSWPLASSIMATPFSTRMMARRAAHTLIGSYDAFNTNTGACMDAHCGPSGSPATRAWCIQPAKDFPYRDAALWTELDIALLYRCGNFRRFDCLLFPAIGNFPQIGALKGARHGGCPNSFRTGLFEDASAL